MLLTHDPNTDRGFVGFRCAYAHSDAHGVRGYVDLNDRGPQMRQRVTIEREAGCEVKLLELSLDAASGLMRQTGVDANDAMLVACEPEAGFAAALAAGLAIPHTATFSDRPRYGDTHSSSVLLAARLAGLGTDAQAAASAVLVAAGSGLSCAAAVYRVS
jgi:3-oxoacyl-[acyl-carrier-protein] synthase III